MRFSNRASTSTSAPTRCNAIAAAAAAGAIAAAVGLVQWAGSAAAAAAWLPWRCPLRACTGIACPTCGLGRGLLAAAAGDWRGAWAAHPLALVLPVVGPLFWFASWRWPHMTAAVTRAAFGRRRVTATLLLLYVAFGVART